MHILPHSVTLSASFRIVSLLFHSFLDVCSFFLVQALLLLTALATDGSAGVVPEGKIQLGVVGLM